MSVFASIATIFIENLIAVTGLIAAGFMVVEYYRRSRTVSTLLFAATLATMSLGFVVAFIGQLFYVYLGTPVGAALVISQRYFTLFSGLFLILATVHAYRFTHRRAWGGIAVVACAAVLAMSSGTPGSVTLIQGIPMHDVSIFEFFTGYLPWILAQGFIAVVAGAAYIRGRRMNMRHLGADLYLLRAGLIGLLVIVLSSLMIELELGQFLWASFGLVLLQLLTLFMGGTAKDHHDDAIAEHPPNVIGRSMVFKALAVNTALFWILAFSLVSITATYFVSTMVYEREEVMVRDLRLLSVSHRNAGQNLLESAVQFAEHPSVIAAFQSGTGGDEEMDAMMRGDDDVMFVYILDLEGNLIYGPELSKDDVAALQMSTIVRTALEGRSVAGIERDAAHGTWSLLAAAPVILDDGSVGGVVIGADAVVAIGLREFAEFTTSKATGYGFVSSTDEPIFTAGHALDVLTRHEFKRRLNGSSATQGRTMSGDLYYVTTAERTDGTYDGFFYIFLTQEAVNGAIFRILSVIMIFVTLFVLMVAAVLVFSMLIVLRPVRELKEAARRIEHGDYDLHIAYDKPDELGQLAAAFNGMSSTIKERTISLNEAIRQQRDFLTHTAHEMRTPLNIFRWSLEMLRFGDTGPLNKEQLELVEQMHQTNERIRKLVMNMIDASRIERGALELRRDFVSIEDVIDDVAGALSVRIREKNINLHWNRPDEPLPKVYADSDRVYQVLLNLLSNAVKYTHRNGHIELEAREAQDSGPSGREGRFLRVTVEDNGRGIPELQQSKIFTRFFRASNVVAEELEGTGLGLFISKQIVELHGGEIWFESQEGEGSTFAFTIPTKKP